MRLVVVTLLLIQRRLDTLTAPAPAPTVDTTKPRTPPSVHTVHDDERGVATAVNVGDGHGAAATATGARLPCMPEEIWLLFCNSLRSSDFL